MAGTYNAVAGADVSGSLCQFSLNGRYIYLQEWNSRPAYVLADGSRFIYYLSLHAKWYMGDTLGSITVRAQAESNAADVFGINGGWLEFCDGAWSSSGLTLQVSSDCTDCIAGKSMLTLSYLLS